jgi:hypothetical protein
MISTPPPTISTYTEDVIVPRWRRILFVALVLVLAAFALGYVRLLPVTATLLLGLTCLSLARPGFLSLPAAFAAQFLFIIGAAIEGAGVGAGARDDVAGLALALVFLLPAVGLVAPLTSDPSASPLPVARVTRRR